jgi:hypothetical protein
MQENGKMSSEFVKKFCLIKYMSVEFFNNFWRSKIGIGSGLAKFVISFKVARFDFHAQLFQVANVDINAQ